MRDEIVGFILRWSKKLKLPVTQFLDWLSLSPNKFYDWKRRQGKENKTNANLPKSNWLLPWEREAIIEYAKLNPDEGYRRLTYMMLDSDVVAVSPSSTYRILQPLGLLCDFDFKKSKKGTGFIQPTFPNEHWHTDISYINIACTFYYFLSVLDGDSRLIIYWDLRKSMTEEDVEIVLLRAHEKYPDAKPRVISDNGKQYIANDFKLFIRQQEMSHVTTSPYYPQSNGKIERFHGTLKSECVRKEALNDSAQAKLVLEKYVDHYNDVRLHSAIGYVTPIAKFNGEDKNIVAARKNKIKLAAIARRKINESVIPKS